MPQQLAITSHGPIEYRLEGSGPTVMVLQGGHCSWESRLSHEGLADHGFSVLVSQNLTHLTKETVRRLGSKKRLQTASPQSLANLLR